MENSTSAKSNWLYIAGLALVFIASFSYIFDSKLDLNGDNCTYYMLATSIAQGHGFADITSTAYTPSNVFPPGYPLLMSVVRLFTESFILQKIVNGLFLLGSAILLFFLIRKNKLSDQIAFVAATAVLLNYQVLHFATMMMSEMSFLFTSVLACWFINKMDEKKTFWKDPFFYLAIITASYNYHIRTQGIALIAAILGYFLFNRQWKQMLSFAGGFAICLLPWMIRNKAAGLGQSRYMDVIAMSNPWRPEEGTLGLGEITSRFFETFRMLATQAVPDSILPYIASDYGTTPWHGWLIAIAMWAFIGIGIWQLGKYKYLILFYILATFGIISIFSSPSGNRYITPLVPYLEVTFLIGIYTTLSAGVRKLKIARQFSPWILVLLFLFCSFPRLQSLRATNTMQYPAAYQNFFKIAEEVRKQVPQETVVCSRKPELFYMFSKAAVTMYAWTDNEQELIRGLVDSNVGYVVLEQLGFSSTARYLYPAIQKNPDLFPIVMHLKNPDTYLLKFDKGKAIKKFNLDISE